MCVAGRAWYVSKPTSETSPRPVRTRRRRTEVNSYGKQGAGWRIFRQRLTDEQMLTASLSGELAGCDVAWTPLDGFEEPEVDGCSAAGAVGRL